MEKKTLPAKTFPDTRWSLIERVRCGDASVETEALEELCARYWQPLYGFLRLSGHDRSDAEDLTQSFFASILERNVLGKVGDGSRGRLRSFLLTCLKNFTHDAHRTATAEKRGGDRPHLSIDFSSAEDGLALETSAPVNPDQAFDQQWVATLLGNVLDRLEQIFLERGSREHFALIKEFLAWNGAEISYAEAAEKIGTTEGALKVQVHRLRSRFRELLREEVASTLEDPAQTDDEIRHLFAVFGDQP